MKEAIGAAEENKFSEFSKKVKTSLEDKLRNNPKMKDNISKMEQASKMRDAFAKISDEVKKVKKVEEPNEPVEPVEPEQV